MFTFLLVNLYKTGSNIYQLYIGFITLGLFKHLKKNIFCTKFQFHKNHIHQKGRIIIYRIIVFELLVWI